MPTLHIQLLGNLKLTYGDAPLQGVNSPRLQSLFAYLVLHRHAPQNRRQLAFQFWPDSTEAQARANLRFFLHRLRSTLPNAEHFMEVNDSSVMWRADAAFTLDVAEFEDALAGTGTRMGDAAARVLEGAVELYQGELLPSCYDDWIFPERERLRQLYVGALERLSLWWENQSDHRAAIAYAQQLLRHDPLHEETYRRLMRLHALNGDRVSALRVFHTCAAVLERELAVQPSPATLAQYEQLLRTVSQTSGTKEHTLPGSAALQLPNVPPHNLRLALTSFIGREREISEIKRLLATTRLLTLTGVGGTGKTRLALEVATQLLVAPTEHSPDLRCADGAWWVDLVALSDPALVARTAATAFGLRERQNKSLIETLVEFLHAKQILLVLDNCEHLLDACAELAETLLLACPGVRILTTSREPLKIMGETTRSVPPLSMPEQEPHSKPDWYLKVTQSEAVRLFDERAAQAFPAFDLTRKNAPAVVEICRKLDGLPLAIELAAARVKMLKPEQIAARLEDRFNLLKMGQRRGAVRHQSLRAVVDWSYELLAPAERLLFGRLPVFAGGFSLEAVEVVCSGDGIHAPQVLELLSLLVDKSLVMVEQDTGEGRFDLLETLRQYANERMLESHQAQSLGSRHAAFYLAFAERAKAELRGPQERVWLERLELEHDNFRAALQYATESEDRDTALRMSCALGIFWDSHGHFTEGRQWLETTLARSGTDTFPVRADAMFRLGHIIGLQGDMDTARTWLEQSLEQWEALGDRRGMIPVLLEFANNDSFEGDLVAAHRRLDQSLAIARELGDRHGIALAQFHLGVALMIEGDTAGARRSLEESLKLFREVGWSRGAAFVLNSLGEVARVEGDYDQAAVFYRESLTLVQELGDKLSVASSLINLGFVALHRGETIKAKQSLGSSLKLLMEAGALRLSPASLAGLAGVLAASGRTYPGVRLLAAAIALRAADGIIWEPPDRAEVERIMAALRQTLDPESYDRAWAEGNALTQDEAIAQALAAAE